MNDVGIVLTSPTTIINQLVESASRFSEGLFIPWLAVQGSEEKGSFLPLLDSACSNILLGSLLPLHGACPLHSSSRSSAG